MSRFSLITAALAAAIALASPVQAQTPAVKVESAWARVTVPGQKGTGAFMTLTAAQGLRLVGVQSPVAGISEIHEMKMEGDVMRMRAINALELPAGQAVAIFSVVEPSWRGPRYSVQSAPWEASEAAIREARTRGRCMS